MTSADWIAIVFGVLSFIISMVALTRSIRAEAKIEEASLNQNRFEVLNLMVRAEISLRFARKPWQDLLEDARSLRRENLSPTANTTADTYVERAHASIEALDKKYEIVRDMRTDLGKDLPTRNKWGDLLKVLNGWPAILIPMA